MDRQLPEEQLNELLPGLKRLAEFISAGETLDRRAFREIATSIDINGEEWALGELELWSHILIKTRNALNTEDSIVAELQSRGIPEFPARLAFKSAKPQPMKVELNFVDFGNLKIGERPEPRTLTVVGERVIKAICGPRIKVTLLDSGLAKTLVRIQLADGSPGETVREEITLRGSTGELRITITAQWEAEPPLLSWCPVHGDIVRKKCLFFNKHDKRYECFYGKETYPYPDKRVSEYNATHK